MKKNLFLLIAISISLFSSDSLRAQNSDGKFNKKTAKTLLQGSWFDDQDDNAEFFIIGDSIGYPDNMDKYKYTLTDDTLDILTTQPHYKQVIIKLTEDSLIVKNMPDKTISKYWHN